MESSGVFSLGSSIFSGITNAIAHSRTDRELSDMRNKLKMPDSVFKEDAILEDQSERGLSDYETRQQEIETQIPQNLNQVKDFLTGGGLIDYLSKATAHRDQQLRELAGINEAKKTENKNRYATFLGNKAKWEENLDSQKRDLMFKRMANEQAGTQDFLNTVNSSMDIVGSLSSSIGSAIGGNKSSIPKGGEAGDNIQSFQTYA